VAQSKGRKKKEFVVTRYGNLNELDSANEESPNSLDIDEYESFLKSLPSIPVEWQQSYERIFSLTTKEHIDTEEKFYQYLVEKLRIMKNQLSNSQSTL
jgi:hypothetical protein